MSPYLQSETTALHVNDYKSLLQEQAQRIHKQSPKYQVLHESGPGSRQAVPGLGRHLGEVKGIGWGKSKKEAEQEAPKALEELAMPSVHRVNVTPLARNRSRAWT